MKKPDHWLVEHLVKQVTGNTVWLILVLVGGAVFFWLSGIWGTIKDWLGTPVEIYRWHYWLLLIAGPLAGFAIARLFSCWALRQAGPEHTRYAEDTFFGIVWRWQWTQSGHLNRSSITPYCVACSRQMMFQRSYDRTTHVVCEHCESDQPFQGSDFDLQLRVGVEIEKKLREGTWKAAD